ncbi:MAG: methylated-DNA--[protein]-cysteine S-methyltransferase [Acidimicrobiales bacterium]
MDDAVGTRVAVRTPPLIRGGDVTTVRTPAGPLSIAWDGEAVVAAGFTTDLDRLDVPDGPTEPVPDTVLDAVGRYFAGDVTAMDEVPVSQRGTPVQEEVWRALRSIAPGTVMSYGDVARAIGRPRAARAVGSACGSNHVALFVPCHRVVRSDGTLGGYGWGLDVKEVLLGVEATAG